MTDPEMRELYAALRDRGGVAGWPVFYERMMGTLFFARGGLAVFATPDYDGGECDYTGTIEIEVYDDAGDLRDMLSLAWPRAVRSVDTYARFVGEILVRLS
jgi:hypothetical protein